MYPENLTIDGWQHRTTRLNEAIQLIYQIDKELSTTKKGTNYDFSSLSLHVLPKGFEPLSSVPETEILSIELRKQLFMTAKLIHFV